MPTTAEPASPPSRRYWLTVLALFATLHLLLFYGLPAWMLLLAFITLGIFYFRAGAMAAMATTVSIGIATLLCSIAVHLLGLDKAMYYRPHEQLVQQDYEGGFRRYRADARIEMAMPHGDLKALTSANLAQPRKVVFQTDSEGFRNDRDYAGGDIVLIGDSFVVGMGDSQEDTLSTQLRRDHDLAAYNLGHPGDISDYLATWRAFRQRHPGPVRAALFLFEGNDFEERYDAAPANPPGWLARWSGQYYGLFTNTDLYRVTKSLYARATKAKHIADSDSVRIVTLAGQPMGLYAPYSAVTARPHYAMPTALATDLTTLASQVEHIFFIPTVDRVYARHLDQPAPPHAQWQALAALCQRNHWQCTDLTPALVATSDTLLAQGQLTWWRDDTHWNRAGMAAAAGIVAEQLRSHARH